MYIPHQYKLEDREQIMDFLQRYNFGTLTSSCNGRLHSTHLPFHFYTEGDTLKLSAHLAKVNPQWQEIGTQEVLLVFSGPHAYISPSHYEKELNVPTWNYIAVHLYGKVRLVTDEQRGLAILEELMRQSEPEYLEQWNRLPDKYKDGLYQGIVPLEITVTEIQAKHKLSQNKTAAERRNIFEALAKSEDGAARETAGYMKENEMGTERS